MKITSGIVKSIQKAVDQVGSQQAFAALTGVSQTNISKYMSGKISYIRKEVWDKIEPHILPYLKFYCTENSNFNVTACEISKNNMDKLNFFLDMGAKFEINFEDKSTCMLLEYWRDMTAAQRFELLSKAAEISEREQR